MSLFDKAFRFTLDNEGGYRLHNIKGDPGKQTFAGISQRAHPKWIGWKYIDQCKMIEAQECVKDFYFENYWHKSGIYKLQDIFPELALYLFDFAVNVGVKTAIRRLQRVLGVKQDGIIGKITIMSVYTNMGGMGKPQALINKFTLERSRFYCQLANHNKKFKKFLLGWMNRLHKKADMTERREKK